VGDASLNAFNPFAVNPLQTKCNNSISCHRIWHTDFEDHLVQWESFLPDADSVTKENVLWYPTDTEGWKS